MCIRDRYFSVVDVVGALTDQSTPRGASTYWAVLKKRLKEEGADQLLTNCKQLKMTAADGRKRLTDVADTEQLLRIIQSIPAPKAEPFKPVSYTHLDVYKRQSWDRFRRARRAFSFSPNVIVITSPPA